MQKTSSVTKIIISPQNKKSCRPKVANFTETPDKSNIYRFKKFLQAPKRMSIYTRTPVLNFNVIILHNSVSSITYIISRLPPKLPSVNT